MNTVLLEELQISSYIHAPLPRHPEKSLEAELRQKPSLKARPIWRDGTLSRWKSTGDYGNLTLEKNAFQGENAIRFSSPICSDHFPPNASPDGDYCNYGLLKGEFSLDRENFSEYNRLSFWVKPTYPGPKCVTFIAALVNEGEVRIPDRYHREGYHVLNLENEEWNHCIWEFPDLPRDAVTKLIFYTFLNGNITCTSSQIQFDLAHLLLEKIENPEFTKGWQGAENRILYSTLGYFEKGKKEAIYTGNAQNFSLINQEGKIVFSGESIPFKNDKGTFSLLDFSSVKAAQNLRLKVEDQITPPFSIQNQFLEEALWKSINFLFCERCGYPVPGIHGSCHLDLFAEHNGQKIPYFGGWHDAGDMSQQTSQTAEIADAFLTISQKLIHKDPILSARLQEEAEWGFDFLLHTRFADGVHAMDAGVTRYTDNILGSFDDPFVRVAHRQLEDFLLSSIEANYAVTVKKSSPGQSCVMQKLAIEDFSIGLRDFSKNGFVQPDSKNGHTRALGESHFYAIASIAASRLFQLTNEKDYAQKARSFMNLMLSCQETSSDLPYSGFFYRAPDHKMISHANHQSREYLFAQALALIAQTQKDAPELALWEKSMRLHADYLKGIMNVTKPYSMIPAGIYHLSETEDKDSFFYMHHGSNYELEKENFKEQIQKGVPLGNGYFLRAYPVWFSFRGNCAVMLASARAAAILGNYLNDEALLQIAREQLYFTLGKNPFGQSIMYGVGYRYAQQYATSSGELAGEMPVGIESFENEDIPYWPQSNNCTYKEIWTSPTARFLWTAAELL